MASVVSLSSVTHTEVNAVPSSADNRQMQNLDVTTKHVRDPVGSPYTTGFCVDEPGSWMGSGVEDTAVARSW